MLTISSNPFGIVVLPSSATNSTSSTDSSSSNPLDDPQTVAAFNQQLLKAEVLSALLMQQLTPQTPVYDIGSSDDSSLVATVISAGFALSQTQSTKALITGLENTLANLQQIASGTGSDTSATSIIDGAASGDISDGSDIAEEYADLNISLGLEADLSTPPED